MNDQAPQARRTSGFLFLAIAGACLLGIAGVFGWAFLHAVNTISESTTDLVIDGTVCQPQQDWGPSSTLFLLEGAGVTGEQARAAITVRDAAGNTIPLGSSPQISVTLTNKRYSSVGSLDLKALPPDTEVCIEIDGLDTALVEGDVMVVGAFASPLVTGILSTCLVSVVLGIAAIVSLVMARARLQRRE